MAGAVANKEKLPVSAIADAYRSAVDQERLAYRFNGHVSGETQEQLRAIGEQLRASLQSYEGMPIQEVAERLRLLAEISEKMHRVEAREVDARMEALTRIHHGLVRLRKCGSPQELLKAAPDELLRTCGFSRAMLSRVRGSLWVPEILKVTENVDPEVEAFQSFVEEAEIPLAHMLLETELVRRRIPAIVTDPQGDERTFKPLVEVARCTSYAAAPIMPTNRVIGFFHVDRFGQGLPVTPEDRDALWAFAEHFGLLYERAILVERLEGQRAQLADALSNAILAVDELCSADIELVRNEHAPEIAPEVTAASPHWRLGALLTLREREVLDLMATGATNIQIAQGLVVSEGTVKSHVKRILRKLHVSNRSEAVARYLHLKRVGA
jgi:DNA-binding CsgD family transcriptional regulator